MPRLSKLLEKLEDRVERRWGSWAARHKIRLRTHLPLFLIVAYFYGMFLNSLKLGIAATFHTGEETVESIWVFNPFFNLLVLVTPFGLGVTAVLALLTCLITKKGYLWFSGYKYTRDPRGFDILPDATHGSSGFLTEAEMRTFLELGSVSEVQGMMLGKHKRHDGDPDRYDLYAAHTMRPGDSNNLLCIGAPGTGKSRGFVLPFLLGCARRKESVYCVDPKGELFEKLSVYFRQQGYYVKAMNFLDTVAQAMSEIVYAAEKKQIGVSVDCPENLTVAHDSKWTAEALFNLLDNAVKYTPAGGKITVTVEEWEMYAEIKVADTGKGISESNQAAIFRRFYREEEVHEQPGVGIGLYLAREIVTKQGGYIKVVSELGNGSAFSIMLPLR